MAPKDKCANKVCESHKDGRRRECNPDTGRCKLVNSAAAAPKKKKAAATAVDYKQVVDWIFKSFRFQEKDGVHETFDAHFEYPAQAPLEYYAVVTRMGETEGHGKHGPGRYNVYFRSDDDGHDGHSADLTKAQAKQTVLAVLKKMADKGEIGRVTAVHYSSEGGYSANPKYHGERKQWAGIVRNSIPRMNRILDLTKVRF